MLTIATNPIFQRSPDAAQEELRHRTTLLRRSAGRQMQAKLQSRNCIKEIASLPGTEETLHIIARGNFPLFSVIPAILELAKPSTIISLSVATLGYSKSNAAELLGLMDAGKVQRVNVVCSVYFQRMNPAEYRELAEGLSARGQRIAAIRNHAKVICIELSDGRHFAIESSANLRSCRNLEQLSITNSRELTEFHQRWINEVIREAK